MTARGLQKGFRIGDWLIEPASLRASTLDTSRELTPDQLRLLLLLAARHGEAIDRRELRQALWPDQPGGEARLRGNFPSWEPLSVMGLMQEMELFLSELELKRTIFRTDHASNWLILKGTLGADKLRLLQELRAAIAAPEAAPLRPAWARGL